MSLEARLALHVRTGKKGGEGKSWLEEEEEDDEGDLGASEVPKGTTARRRGTDGGGGTDDEDEKNGRSQHGPRAAHAPAQARGPRGPWNMPARPAYTIVSSSFWA